MKKIMKTSLTAIIAIALVCALSMTCFADSYVTYTGNSGDFVFAPGSEESPTDLFENFKDVMPGDVLTQQIVVKNDADKKVNVEIFLRSLGADEGSEAFLEQLSLSVKEVEGKLLSDGNAAEKAGLADFVSLGKIASGSTVTLEVSLKVPNDLSDEFAEALGKLTWEFKVEEKPVEVKKTGDNSQLALYAVTFTAALAACAVLLAAKRKKTA